MCEAILGGLGFDTVFSRVAALDLDPALDPVSLDH